MDSQMSKIALFMEEDSGSKTVNDTPIYVSWKNLCFEVEEKEKKGEKNIKKKILNGLCGHAQPGELIAVIGPSGSGKSSFLNCIAGRINEGITGEILFNDVIRPSNLSKFTGYVIQDDVYLESLTVREILTFVADLKLPITQSKESKKDRVNYILNQLDLNNCANTKVGKIGSGISGGERRRLSIGIEIINSPSLLLLDEPTSGLDSSSALMIGKILKNLSKTNGLTIICTIHQPRYQLAVLFDKLYFLAKGKEMYFGKGIPYCLPFFEKNGYICPQYQNPLDFLLDLVNERDKNTQDDNNTKTRDEIVDHLHTSYIASEFYQLASTQKVPDEYSGNVIFEKFSKDFYITPVYNQIYIVTKRSFLHKLREPIATVTQGFNAVIVPLLFGSVYWQMDLSQQQAFDRISAISLLILTLSFFTMDILLLFPQERIIFNRENTSGMYRPLSFYIGRSLSEFPQHVIFSIIMANITYFMYGLQLDVDKYLIYNIIVILAVFTGASLFILFSSISANMEQSNMLATVVILLFMLFDGNWISIDKIPMLWKWIKYISYMGYAGQAAIVNEYRGLHFACTDEEINNDQCFYHDGNEILYQRGLDGVNLKFNIIMIFVLGICFRILGFIGIWLFYRNKSPLLIIKDTFK